ncbi:hypothetical protein ACJMK2_007183 [Sinanodonta woodiana]|uniref:G-protein coupled receptors family 2 profile 2 domain-containing protein n=1 Tax=Sinanodonta woodiana TaxID=1069815 RepID=A0ABD3VHP7_SINWO
MGHLTITTLNTSAHSSLPDYTLALTATSCCMSIVGAIFICLSYCRIAEIRNFPRKLLLYLTFADILTAFGNLMGTIRYLILKDGEKIANNSGTIFYYASTNEVCVIQSFITTFSSMASFFWTVVIAVYMFAAVVHPSQVFKGVRAECVYHLLSWGIPGAITITAVALNVLGEDHSVGTGSWCWIRSDLEPRVWMLVWMVLSGKGWEILCYVTTMSLYCLLKLKIWERRTVYFSSLNSELREEDKNFMWVWFVLYLLRIWGTIRFFVSFSAIINKSEPTRHAHFVLLNMQGVGDSGQAFWNFVIFCLCDKTVRDRITGRWRNRSESTPLLSPVVNTEAPNSVTF